MDEKIYVEEIERRIMGVVEELENLTTTISNPDSKARELAFATLKLQSLSGELECVSDDLALMAEGEKYAEDEGIER